MPFDPDYLIFFLFDVSLYIINIPAEIAVPIITPFINFIKLTILSLNSKFSKIIICFFEIYIHFYFIKY